MGGGFGVVEVVVVVRTVVVVGKSLGRQQTFGSDPDESHVDC